MRFALYADSEIEEASGILDQEQMRIEVLPAIMRSRVYRPEIEIGETLEVEIESKLKKKAA